MAGTRKFEVFYKENEDGAKIIKQIHFDADWLITIDDGASIALGNDGDGDEVITVAIIPASNVYAVYDIQSLPENYE